MGNRTPGLSADNGCGWGISGGGGGGGGWGAVSPLSGELYPGNIRLLLCIWYCMNS